MLGWGTGNMARNTTQLVRLTVKLLKAAGHKDVALPPADDPEQWLEIDWGYAPFEEPCLYDTCSADAAKWLLQDFAASKSLIGWSVECELAKLLSKRGQLVRREIEPIVRDTDWTAFRPQHLFLSYLAVMPDGAKRAEGLLDIVPEDFRDGLFIACLRLNSRRLDARLMMKFREWSCDPTWGSGSGELGALHAFIKKWVSRWPVAEYSDLMKVYFKRT